MSQSKDTPAPQVSGHAVDDPQKWVPAYPEQVFADESASNRKRFSKLVAKSSPELVKAAKRLAGLAHKNSE